MVGEKKMVGWPSRPMESPDKVAAAKDAAEAIRESIGGLHENVKLSVLKVLVRGAGEAGYKVAAQYKGDKMVYDMEFINSQLWARGKQDIEAATLRARASEEADKRERQFS